MGEIKIRGLTLAQEKAANLFATGSKMSDKVIAKAVKVSASVLASWKKDPRFKVRVLQLFDMNIDIERTYRAKRITKILRPVYKEITKRLQEEDYFDDVSFKELLRMMSQLHNELRIDGNIDKRFLADGIKEYGVEGKTKDDEYEDDSGDEMSEMTSRYEKERADAVGSKKVVSIR